MLKPHVLTTFTLPYYDLTLLFQCGLSLALQQQVASCHDRDLFHRLSELLVLLQVETIPDAALAMLVVFYRQLAVSLIVAVPTEIRGPVLKSLSLGDCRSIPTAATSVSAYQAPFSLPALQ